MENPIKMDDLGGFPIIFGNTHVKNTRYSPWFAKSFQTAPRKFRCFDVFSPRIGVSNAYARPSRNAWRCRGSRPFPRGRHSHPGPKTPKTW